METRPALRASDADREKAAQSLASNFAAGRLSGEELSQRLEDAYRARTVAELEELLSDLPTTPRAKQTSTSQAARAGLPGHSPFDVRYELERPPAAVLDEARRKIVPHLLQMGYELAQDTSAQVVLTRRIRPAWTILAAVVAFPVGLIALLHHVQSQVVLRASRHKRGTALHAYGVAPRAVRKAFLELLEP